MAKGKPTHEQVDLYLRLYELRREEKLRRARDWFANNFFAKTPEEMMQTAPQGSEENAYFRMVITYWEMVCTLLNYGLLHEDLFFATTGEQFMVWERIKGMVPAWREQFGNPRSLGQMETAARKYEKWYEREAPGSLAKMQQMMAAMEQARQQGR